MESAIVNQESFRDWKANPVTKKVMELISMRITELQRELGVSAGIDPILDRYKSGAIGAYTDLLEISFDEATSD